MSLIRTGDLDRRITFRSKATADGAAPDEGGFMGAGQEQWSDFATVWAQVQEVLPSRGDRLAEGLTIQSRPARVRMRWRGDITGDMQILYGARTMRIIAGPVELGRREGLELMAQDYSTQGVPG